MLKQKWAVVYVTTEEMIYVGYFDTLQEAADYIRTSALYREYIIIEIHIVSSE